MGDIRKKERKENKENVDKQITEGRSFTLFYHIIYKSSNRNKVRDKFGITYFEKLITMQIRSRD